MNKMMKTALMAATALLALGACTVDKGKLLSDMTGTWESAEEIGDQPATVSTQFFANKDGETGNFVEEVSHFQVMEDKHGLPYNVHYEVYATGTYQLNDAGDLCMQYDTASVEVYPNEEDMKVYRQRVQEWDAAQESPSYANSEDNPEMFSAYLVYLFNFDVSDLWKHVFADISDKKGSPSKLGLKIDGSKLTFSNVEGTKCTWTRAKENIVEEDFFDDDEDLFMDK